MILYIWCLYNTIGLKGANTGNVLWKFQKPGLGTGAPVVVNGHVYVATGNSVYAFGLPK